MIALNIGGDDYIKKPYTLRVLLAKVKVMMKRMGNHSLERLQEKAVKPSRKTIYLEEATMQVCIRGKEIPLKAKEFRLLQCLYENRNTIVSKETLFDQVIETALERGTDVSRLEKRHQCQMILLEAEDYQARLGQALKEGAVILDLFQNQQYAGKAAWNMERQSYQKLKEQLFQRLGLFCLFLLAAGNLEMPYFLILPWGSYWPFPCF